ncbi:HAMP domain-containing sensor histidine kinase [Kitasatospora terrestris]|uniref:histidine kinase n=1 Tax=Kitasatospora terrestris TaxID=258051 RepID=A0ABP9E076_9ACTN
MLTAAAVAVTIALAALACWFVVEGKLYDQVRNDLARAPYDVMSNWRLGRSPVQVAECDTTAAGAVEKAQATAAKLESTTGGTGTPGPRPGAAGPWNVQLLSESGDVCAPLSSPYKAFKIEPSDVDATTLGWHKATYRDGSYVDGTPAMVRQSSWTGTLVDADGKTTTGTFVMLTAVPVTSVHESLQQLALVLLGVAAVGVIGAGATGRVVARSALKPVDDLTDAVEHIARTEEVGTTIPVHGKDEIARLSTSFNSMSTALLNSRERQTRLIADAGHELRTPLTSLRTNVDLLIRSDETGRALPPATRQKLLGSMKAQMQELTVLIGDLLQLSRPDSPRPGGSPAVVAFHEIVDRAVERGRLRGPGLRFEVSVEPWYVRGDAAALERAVVNLLDNAVKYSPPGGTVAVELRQGRLVVRDHGPGIPADELPYVFDRFWRSPSSRQLPGSGLGLSIVAQTVRETDGEVALGPAPDGGAGTQATMRLPGRSDRP